MDGTVFAIVGSVVAALLTIGAIILGFQWLTTFPFRWGWRRHAGPIGRVLSKKEQRAP